WEQNTRVGGILAKNEGRIYRYNLQGNIVIVGPKIGDFELSGRVGGYFTLWKDSVAMKAMARIRNTSASYFWEHYYSNHFIWNNNFDKEFQTYIGGSIELPKRHLKLGLQVANNTNCLYFNANAMPTQASGSVQIVALDASLDLFLGKHFVLENKGVYQVSSNQNVIPLPALALYNNLYYQTKLFNVLRVQLGVSSHFHTSYYAPAYMPATGQFYVQNKIKIGNYPLASAYANFHLKKTRFFLEYYHVNQSFMPNQNYFSMPNYPMNPTTMKMGISWNFYD
ncbi:MAG: putative porin, partial [Bacteroidota bacterium]|nr:putative porin [Bacteroidota bacterium]